MKCVACGNTEKFYEPVSGYRILYYADGKLSDARLEEMARDDNPILCGKCEETINEEVSK